MQESMTNSNFLMHKIPGNYSCNLSFQNPFFSEGCKGRKCKVNYGANEMILINKLLILITLTLQNTVYQIEKAFQKAAKNAKIICVKNAIFCILILTLFSN
jgi:hypothetical protein